jgi:hypothetical protein
MFGVSARRVTVRSAMPWYVRWPGLAGLFAAALLVARSTYDFAAEYAASQRMDGERQAQQLVAGATQLQEEVVRLRANAAKHEREQQIEQASYANLVKQVKSLGEENARLKEDLAFFQTLMPPAGNDSGVVINVFRVQNDVLPGEYHYRLLLTQTGDRAKDFRGRLQFVINMQRDGRTIALILPSDSDKDAALYQVQFRIYQRVDGTFRVDPQAAVKSVQVRVYEEGGRQPRTVHTAGIS